MGVAERKGRERAERERRITAAARGIAAREGWSARYDPPPRGRDRVQPAGALFAL